MTILTSVTEFEDRVVTALRDLQRPVVHYVRKGVERAEGRIPRLNYPASLPRPTEVVDSQVGFAKKLLDTQRDFARELADAVAPLVEPADDAPAATASAVTGDVPTPPATSTTRARKGVARKTAAKTATKKKA
ncbi:MAG TPA: hypothetical protein VIL36_11650 [Acidimicrobiales bacterium]